MRLPQAGGCQCGGVRYEITLAPLTLYACHCAECQRQSGSAFGMSMPVPTGGVRIAAGEPRAWRRTAASGRVVACLFCGECGTRLMHRPERDPSVVNVKPGTLDDTSWLAPVGHLWTGSAQGWTAPLHRGVTCDGQPADFAPLRDAWAGRGDIPD